jgi:hypothetical protein
MLIVLVSSVTAVAVLSAYDARGDEVAKSKNSGGSGNPDDESKAAIKAIQRLLDTHHLQLSTADQLFTNFHCLVRAAYTSADGKKHGSNYFIERDGDRVGILCCSDEGLPFSFITNDLVVGIDKENPGHLLSHEGINPVFRIAPSRQKSGALCDIAFDTRAQSPTLEIDLADLLNEAIKKLRSGKIGGDGSTVQIQTEHGALIEIEPAKERGGFAIRSLLISGASGDSLAIGSIGAGPHSSVHLSNITKDSFSHLTNPPTNASAEECLRLDTSVRDDFVSDAKEHSAAKEFLDVFKSGKTPQQGRRFNDR